MRTFVNPDRNPMFPVMVEAELSSLEQNQTSSFNSITEAQLVTDGQMPGFCWVTISLTRQYLKDIRLPR